MQEDLLRARAPAPCLKNGPSDERSRLNSQAMMRRRSSGVQGNGLRFACVCKGFGKPCVSGCGDGQTERAAKKDKREIARARTKGG